MRQVRIRISQKSIEIELLGKVRALDGRERVVGMRSLADPKHNQAARDSSG